MKYKPGTFITVPNLDSLHKVPAISQVLFLWICKYSDEEGMCYPGRKKLAKNLGCSIRTIDKHIDILESNGFITKTKRKKEDSKENLTNLYQIQLLHHPSEPNDTTPRAANVPVTKPINNQIHITKVEEDKSSLLPEVVYSSTGELPPNRGKTRIQRVVSIYKDLFKHLYGVEPHLSMAPIGTLIDKLSERYTELQISAMMIIFFDWHGMENDNNFEYKKLLSSTHPFGWFFSTINQYEIYLRNVYRLEFDSELEVRSFVGKAMLAIKDK